jgi:phosphatidylserine/phosphatidylglycerophosphate/cardiolipin synthase-like enzyme
MEADAGHGRLLACCRLALGSGEARSVYVHAKIAVIDDEWLTIGSANLNEHSLFNDTEVNVVVRDPVFARNARRRFWSEHLETDLDRDPVDLVDSEWRPRAFAADRSHRLRPLRGVSRRTRAILGPVNGLLVDGCPGGPSGAAPRSARARRRSPAHACPPA